MEGLDFLVPSMGFRALLGQLGIFLCYVGAPSGGKRPEASVAVLFLSDSSSNCLPLDGQ